MNFKFKFIEKKNFWILISALIILPGFISMGIKLIQSNPALNYGIDFVGGNTFNLKLNSDIVNQEKTSLEIRNTLKNYNLANSNIQFSNSNEIYIKTLAIEKNITSEILKSLKEIIGEFEILEIDFIGPSIGNALKKQALIITILITMTLLLYITLRFELNFGIASIAALIHDSLVVISLSSLFNLEINTAFIAALLTILGYSLNDTIVIFDRIREYLEKEGASNLTNLTNLALNETLIRTINTSITTLLVILSLIFFGGSTIKEFCVILAIGVISGTYSSLCIASPILVKFSSNKNN
jgi:preprotein translocase subunit SecF